MPLPKFRSLFLGLVAGLVLGLGHVPGADAASIDKFIPAPEAMPAPEVVFADADGRERRLSDFRGKVLVVNFWATWCAPCVKEMPALDALSQRLPAEDFAVLAISIDRGGIAVTRPFLEKLGVAHLGLYVDPAGRAPAAFKAAGLPTTIIIDAEGNVRGRLLGAADWASPEAEALVRGHRTAAPAKG